MGISVVPYDPHWPTEYEAVAARLRAVAGALFVADLPACHLHVVPTAGWETRNQRLFRDHLRAHPELADEYGRLEGRLAVEASDGDAYTRAKTGFVQRVVDGARQRRGLPPVSVWE